MGVPGGPSVGSVPHVPAVPHQSEDECCCIAADQECFDLLAVEDLVGEGLIDPRIVNRPPAQPSQLNTLNTCPAGYKTCCYNRGDWQGRLHWRRRISSGLPGP